MYNINRYFKKGGDKVTGISLKAARANADKTQTELAKAVGVSKNLIIDWEKGRRKPKDYQFYKYCAACNVDPRDVDCEFITVARAK